MSKRFLVVGTLVALCAACSSKHPAKPTAAAVSCVGNSNFEQIKVTIKHDLANKPTDVDVDREEVTVYMEPDVGMPDHKGQVCWVIEPVNPGGPMNKLYEPLSVISKDGTVQFGTWTTKKRSAGKILHLESDIPNYENKPGWEYILKCGTIQLDPVIIVIDDGK